MCGRRAWLSPDMLLGTEGTGVSPFGRLVAQARPRFCLGQKGVPGKEALTPGLFLPERTRTLRCGNQQQPTVPTRIAQRTLSFRRGFRPEADGGSLLLPHSGFGRSFSRVREELLRESRCFLCLVARGQVSEPGFPVPPDVGRRSLLPAAACVAQGGTLSHCLRKGSPGSGLFLSHSG